VAMALGADNVVITWRDLGVHLGCVVRVESTGQDSTTSHWDKFCREGVT
jgi:hypothetical protein